MKKKPTHSNDNLGKDKISEPVEAYSSNKKLDFEAHHTFEEMDDAQQAAFMKLSMGERFQKGLALYLMFKDHYERHPRPDSFVLRKRGNK